MIMTRNIPKSIKTSSPRRKILTNHTGISSIMPTFVTAGLSPGHLSKLMARYRHRKHHIPHTDYG